MAKKLEKRYNPTVLMHVCPRCEFRAPLPAEIYEINNDDLCVQCLRRYLLNAGIPKMEPAEKYDVIIDKDKKCIRVTHARGES